MPKVIENLKETILEEAKKQILEIGYSSMTIRSVAKACKIATGTVYNYFPSKEIMVATFMAEEWEIAYKEMQEQCKLYQEPEKVFETIFYGIKKYSKQHEQLFKDEQAEISYASNSPVRHKMLREQIAALLEPVCQKARKPDPFLSQFIAQSLLSWSAEDIAADKINKILINFF